MDEAAVADIPAVLEAASLRIKGLQASRPLLPFQHFLAAGSSRCACALCRLSCSVHVERSCPRGAKMQKISCSSGAHPHAAPKTGFGALVQLLQPMA